MLMLFTIGVLLYTFGILVAALLGHPKARQWVQGRWQQRKAYIPDTVDAPDEQWVWFHAASLGEFEQGRPVMEALKQAHPKYKILLSFFSPSGYEVRKNYAYADEVLYLPADTPWNASKWVRHHHFVAAFFIKYEFWFNYMRALKEAGIPLFYVSLILSRESFFFKPYGKWFSRQLDAVTHFFVQDEDTVELLRKVGYDNVTLCGDTRFDRVAAIAELVKPFPDVERFINGRQCIIAGSTWPPDERLLKAFLPKLPDGYCLIIAPHDVSESHVAQIKAMFPQAMLYTEWSTLSPCHDEAQPNVSMGKDNILIINTIGILSQLYQYARFVYIGGGFSVNIHNIQEPVTFGCPVVFGPKYKSFKEAVDLVALQGAFSIRDADGLETTFLRLMDDGAFYAQASETCRDYLKSQVGATKIIMQGFEKTLFS